MTERLQLVVRQDGATSTGNMMVQALQAVRRHLAMDVGYVSEFVGDRSFYRSVDAPGLEHLIAEGELAAP